MRAEKTRRGRGPPSRSGTCRRPCRGPGHRSGETSRQMFSTYVPAGDRKVPLTDVRRQDLQRRIARPVSEAFQQGHRQ